MPLLVWIFILHDSNLYWSHEHVLGTPAVLRDSALTGSLKPSGHLPCLLQSPRIKGGLSLPKSLEWGSLCSPPSYCSHLAFMSSVPDCYALGWWKMPQASSGNLPRLSGQFNPSKTVISLHKNFTGL